MTSTGWILDARRERSVDARPENSRRRATLNTAPTSRNRWTASSSDFGFTGGPREHYVLCQASAALLPIERDHESSVNERMRPGISPRQRRLVERHPLGAGQPFLVPLIFERIVPM